MKHTHSIGLWLWDIISSHFKTLHLSKNWLCNLKMSSKIKTSIKIKSTLHNKTKPTPPLGIHPFHTVNFLAVLEVLLISSQLQDCKSHILTFLQFTPASNFFFTVSVCASFGTWYSDWFVKKNCDC